MTTQPTDTDQAAPPKSETRRQRLPRGATLADAQAALTAEQRQLVERVRDARGSHTERVGRERAVLPESVRQAIEAGVSPLVLQHALGDVNKARVYQLTKEAAAADG